MGISRSTLHNILSGKTNPSYYVIVNLVEALNLSIVDVISIFFPNIILNKESKYEQLTY